MQHINASNAWAITRGAGVTIAIVDTGVDGRRSELCHRSPLSLSPNLKDPWNDAVGHGTMCASIACGKTQGNGAFNGVAPDATLLSARSTLRSLDLYTIYDELIAAYVAGNHGTACCRFPDDASTPNTIWSIKVSMRS